MAQTRLEEFIGQLHTLAFFAEFTFSKNKFSPTPSTELELADNIVWLGDMLCIFQLKERKLPVDNNAAEERRWFHNKVLRKGTKQIRSSLEYLQSHPKIEIANERGHTFNISAASFDEIIKLIVYLPGPALPPDCKKIKHHTSSKAGFIHILPASDYLEICRTLRVPADIFDYFGYRQGAIKKATDTLEAIAEPLIMGQYLSGNNEEPPSSASYQFLQKLIQDSDQFDLSGILKNLREHIETTDKPTDYYQIMVEIARVPRSGWREIKKRILLCIDHVNQGKFAQPYRLTFPRTGCGFVFIPVDQELVKQPNWPQIQTNGLKNFVHAHKYDQKLDKCIGIQFAKDGSDFLIHWCRIDFPWQQDQELEKKLADSFPFRKVREQKVDSFLFISDQTE